MKKNINDGKKHTTIGITADDLRIANVLRLRFGFSNHGELLHFLLTDYRVHELLYSEFRERAFDLPAKMLEQLKAQQRADDFLEQRRFELSKNRTLVVGTVKEE